MIKLQIVRDEGKNAVCRIVQEGAVPFAGPAELRILARVELRHADGIPEERTLHSQRLQLGAGAQDVPLPQQTASYDYHGQQIGVRLALQLMDGKGKALAEARLRDSESVLVAPRPKLSDSPEALMSPKDDYSLLANLRALPASVGLTFGGLGLALYVLAAVNLAVGLRDQRMAEAPLTGTQRLNLTLAGRTEELERVRVAPILYGKGPRRVPALDALKISLILCVIGGVILRKQLHRYGDFRLFLLLPPLRPGTRVEARRLLRGRAQVDLLNVTVRVVAGNLECWRRKPAAGEKSEKTVRTPVRAVKLYERALPYVPAQTSIGDFLEGDVDFTPMFRALYPPLMVTNESGLDLVWQVHILHPEFVDQALPGPTSNLRFADFLEG